MGSWYDALATGADQLAWQTDEAVGSVTNGGVSLNQWTEAYTRALGSGLVEPQTGSPSLVDPEGDFGSTDYDGSAFAPDVITQGGQEAGEQTVDAAADAVDTVTPGWVDWIAQNQSKAILAVVALIVLLETDIASGVGS